MLLSTDCSSFTNTQEIRNALRAAESMDTRRLSLGTKGHVQIVICNVETEEMDSQSGRSQCDSVCEHFTLKLLL